MSAFRDAARTVSSCAVLLVVTLLADPARAQEDVIQSLKNSLADIQRQLKDALARIEQLEKEKAAAADKIDEVESSTSSRLGQVEKSVQAVQSAASALNPAIGAVLDANIQHRSKSGGNFDFRSAEIGLAASVDPFARMYAFINGTKDGVEVDEAAAVTTSLPWNLTAKGGRFLADFGRFPKTHEHELPFVNEPLSIERFVGGESQADGVEVSYLFPTPFFLRATMGGMNKIGEDNHQVSNDKNRAWSRFTYLSRLNSYLDINDNNNVEFGTSFAYTPSVRLRHDTSGGPRFLGGVDLTYRYQPLGSVIYQGFTLGSELFVNNERLFADDVAQRRTALGGYSYAELKLNKNWSTGFLFDYAPGLSSPGKKTIGYSPFLTWNISEFNRLRFQFTHADDHVREDKDDGGNQVFLQWTTVIGAHTHGFVGR
ncbi:MAG TPA: hypothetical protein VGH16_15130 [Candidatus Binatia bacterium]